MMILCVSTMAFIIPSSEASAKDSDTKLQEIVDEKIASVAEDFDATIGKEYGITYEEYAYAINLLAGRSISVSSSDGVPQAKLSEPMRNGQFGAELHGHYLYVYLDSVSVSMILSGSAAVVGAAIGAAVGSVVPALGTLLGGGLGLFLVATIESALVTAIMEGLNITNGIVAVFKVIDTYKIFRITFEFVCKPVLVGIYAQ